MHRFFVSAPPALDEVVELPPDTARQITRVLRLRNGERIVLFAGDGNEAEAVLEDGAARVVEVRTPQVELPCRLHVAVALLKGEKLDWVVQKLTELGAASISFLITRRAVVDPGVERWIRRAARFQRIATEAAEQCGRVRVPEIGQAVPLTTALREPGPKFFLAHGAGTLLADALRPCPATLMVLVGPEGGFTSEELELAIETGAQAASLGQRVLRAETAALAAAALVVAAAERPSAL